MANPLRSMAVPSFRANSTQFNSRESNDVLQRAAQKNRLTEPNNASNSLHDSQPSVKSTTPSSAIPAMNVPVPERLSQRSGDRAFQMPDVRTSFNSSGKGGGAFRPISEDFQVNPANGTFSLSIPIRTSPGRHGHNLGLALSYDSGHGSGPFGFGWNLPISKISRHTARGVPRYNEDLEAVDCDTFTLGSAGELVLTETNTTATAIVHRYRPRIDNTNLKIERHVDRFDGQKVHWRTVTPDNVTSIFGETDQSRVFEASNGRKRIFSWLLCYTYDSFGNCTQYNYVAEDAAGLDPSIACWESNRTSKDRCRQRYIKSICYGNKSPNRDLATWTVAVPPTDWMFEVVFDYGDHLDTIPTITPDTTWPVRKDAFSRYNAGFEIRNYRLCRRVLMFHHFKELEGQLGRKPCLVSSTVFEYRESERASFLISACQNGYSYLNNHSTHDEIIVDSLPAWTFSYQEIPDAKSLELKRTKTTNLFALPQLGATDAEWIDLEGEGMPGLMLRFADGTMAYQRNINPLIAEGDGSAFSPLKVMSHQPSSRNHKRSYLADLDGTGQKSLITLGEGGRLLGYSDREDNDSWSVFRPFDSIPNVDMMSSNHHRIDLTGDGLLDILHGQITSGILEWQPSLAKMGFAERRMTRSETPALDLRDDSKGISRTYLVDMTGDGLTDIVTVTNGRISYWPNLGHGYFGREICMGNSPVLHQGDQFNQARIHLSDMDGSGTTDLLFVYPGGRAVIFYNLAGSKWSDPVDLGIFPDLNSSSFVSVLDLFGTGVSCLCWIGLQNSYAEPGSLYYLDLMASRKPHILTSYQNGVGSETLIDYRASTEFYLEDEASSRQWATKIPFPVQCVSSVIVTDKVTQSSTTTSYKYHEGHYDSDEREFAGFGMVEQTRQEHLWAGPSQYLAMTPVFTKFWFSTGAQLPLASPHDVFNGTRILSSISPNMSGPNIREACRALRGTLLRIEIYSQDGSSKAKIPYVTTEHSHEIRQLRSPSEHAKGVFSHFSKEIISCRYERNIKNCRIEHNIIMSRNKYGDVEAEATIFYGRLEPFEDVHTERFLPKMSATRILYQETSYTNELDEGGHFLKPKAWKLKQYELMDNTIKEQLNVEKLQSLGVYFDRGKSSLPQQATLRSEERVYFLSSDLKNRLKDGTIEAYSVHDRSYRLCANPGGTDSLYEESGVATFTQLSFKDFMLQSGFETLDDDSRWWVPSSQILFSKDRDANAYLYAARSSFYTPKFAVDPLGNINQMDMDAYNLLPVATTDSIGNTIIYENNYCHLQPIRITDANQNIQECRFNGHGQVIAVAIMGKAGEKVGDSLEGWVAMTPTSVVDDLLIEPDGPLAKSLLGNAASRVVIDLEHRTASSGKITTQQRPPTIIELSRNASFRDVPKVDIQMKVTYLNARGNVIQEVDWVNGDDGAKRWRVGESTIYGQAGEVLRKFQPFYANHASFVPYSRVATPCSTQVVDALGRVVSSIYPNGTWSKVRHESWRTTTFSTGDTVLISDPESDVDVGHGLRAWKVFSTLTTWYKIQLQGDEAKRNAAQACEAYSDTPHISYCDPSGRLIAFVDVCKPDHYVQTAEYDSSDNVVARADQLGRVTEQGTFDMIGLQMKTVSMDSGSVSAFYNCVGKVVLFNPSQGIWGRIQYDALHRQTEIWMKKRDNPLIQTVQMEYGEISKDPAMRNLKGCLWRTHDHAGVSENLEFDHRGNCIRSSVQLLESYNVVANWKEENKLSPDVYYHECAFDYSGQMTLTRDAVGNRTRYVYNKLGNVQAIQHQRGSERLESLSAGTPEWKDYLVSSSYSADDLPLEIHYGNGLTAKILYDEASRLLVRETVTRSGQTVEDKAYTYDCEGRKVHVQRLSDERVFIRNTQIKPESTFNYDALGQLISATGREQLGPSEVGPRVMVGPTAFTGVNGSQGIGDGSNICEFLETYVYDTAGNILMMNHGPAQDTAVTGWSRSYSYREPSLIDASVPNNRLSETTIGKLTESYRYEYRAGQLGCMTSMPGFHALKYDCHGKLFSSSTTKQNNGVPETTFYVYDCAGERVRKVTQRATSTDGLQPAIKMKETIYLPSVELYYEYGGDGRTVTVQKQISYVGNDMKVATIEETRTSTAPLVRFPLGPNLEFDDKGQLISYEEYSPFGACTYAARSKEIEAPRLFRFANYRRDKETGLFYCGARYYAGWLGRWTSSDPLGSIDGQNLFCYSSNDPTNHYDPEGTASIPVLVNAIRNRSHTPQRTQANTNYMPPIHRMTNNHSLSRDASRQNESISPDSSFHGPNPRVTTQNQNVNNSMQDINVVHQDGMPSNQIVPKPPTRRQRFATQEKAWHDAAKTLISRAGAASLKMQQLLNNEELSAGIPMQTKALGGLLKKLPDSLADSKAYLDRALTSKEIGQLTLDDVTDRMETSELVATEVQEVADKFVDFFNTSKSTEGRPMGLKRDAQKFVLGEFYALHKANEDFQSTHQNYMEAGQAYRAHCQKRAQKQAQTQTQARAN